METVKQIKCTLMIPKKIYSELSEEIQEIFMKVDGVYQTNFPVDTQENDFLGECIQAFCEVVLVQGNPKYEVNDETRLKTELMKLGASEKAYGLLIEIQYPGSDKIHRDVLYFQEVYQELGVYQFELLRDQTLFSIEK